MKRSSLLVCLSALILVLGFVSAGTPPSDETFAGKLAAAALERTKHEVVYDPSYVVLDYPKLFAWTIIGHYRYAPAN